VRVDQVLDPGVWFIDETGDRQSVR
jgi:hypothetical protein